MAWWLGEQVVSISSVLIQIVVALFLAAGLNPVVQFFERRGLRRGLAVLTVIVGVLVALTLFVVAFVPVITDQVASISAKAPEWFESAPAQQAGRAPRRAVPADGQDQGLRRQG